MSDPKRWIMVELRGNPNALIVEIDADLTREGLGEWLPIHRLMLLTDIEPRHHHERGIQTPTAVSGEAVKSLGPTGLRPALLGLEGDEQAIRASEIMRWIEASEYLAGIADKGWEVDQKAWRSALSAIVTSNAGALAAINEQARNGGMPRLRLEK